MDNQTIIKSESSVKNIDILYCNGTREQYQSDEPFEVIQERARKTAEQNSTTIRRLSYVDQIKRTSTV